MFWSDRIQNPPCYIDEWKVYRTSVFWDENRSRNTFLWSPHKKTELLADGGTAHSCDWLGFQICPPELCRSLEINIHPSYTAKTYTEEMIGWDSYRRNMISALICISPEWLGNNYVCYSTMYVLRIQDLITASHKIWTRNVFYYRSLYFSIWWRN